MNRGVEHLRRLVEDILGAVAVMEVPVDDHHSPKAPLPDQIGRRDRHVVEEAETHRARGQRMMAGRAYDREGVVGGAVGDRLDRGQDAARRKYRGLERIGTGVGIGIEVVMLELGGARDHSDIGLLVAQRNLVRRGFARGVEVQARAIQRQPPFPSSP